MVEADAEPASSLSNGIDNVPQDLHFSHTQKNNATPNN